MNFMRSIVFSRRTNAAREEHNPPVHKSSGALPCPAPAPGKITASKAVASATTTPIQFICPDFSENTTGKGV